MWAHVDSQDNRPDLQSLIAVEATRRRRQGADITTSTRHFISRCPPDAQVLPGT